MYVELLFLKEFGAIDCGCSVKGYLGRGLLEVYNLFESSEDLVREMKQGNYTRKSEIGEKNRTGQKGWVQWADRKILYGLLTVAQDVEKDIHTLGEH